MRRAFLAIVAMAVLSVAGAGVGTAAPCPETLKVRVSYGYAPFSEKTAPDGPVDGPVEGLDVAFLRRILTDAGCAFEFLDAPWKRSLKLLARGAIDIMPFASITPEREEFARFSVPYRYETVGFVMRRSDAGRYPLDSLEDLMRHDLQIGWQRGAYWGPKFQAFAEAPENRDVVYRLTDNGQGLRMLLSDRIDMLIEQPDSILASAAAQGVRDKLVVHPFLVRRSPVHLMYSRQSVSPELVERIDRAIIAYQETDAYRTHYGRMAIGGGSVDAGPPS